MGTVAALRYPRGSVRPWLHLAGTTVSGLAIIVGSGVALVAQGVDGYDAAFALAIVVLGSAVEWWVHRYAMHARSAAFGRLFDRHVHAHHAAFPSTRMAMRSVRELSIVLLKPWVVLAVAAISLVPALGFALLDLRSFAAISVGVPSAYVLAYELIHLACHSRESWVTARGPLAWLRRHHLRHHDLQSAPANFNVALPLWDVVRGTRAPRVQ